MATIEKKQKRWYSKSTFDSLDKTAIPVGTEIQVTGAIGADDLDSELLLGINGKLTAPTKPLEDSVVTMAAGGNTGTKPLTEFEPFRHRHNLFFTINLQNYNEVQGLVQFKDNHGIGYGLSEIVGIYTLHLSGVLFGPCSLYVSVSNSISLYGVVFNPADTSTPVLLNEENITNFSMTDSVEDL